MDILLALSEEPYTTQMNLANKLGVSIGLINKDLKILLDNTLLTQEYKLSQEALQLLGKEKPQNAIILAAGFGIRMIPLNNDFPKGLIKIKGDILIQRLIEQLHAKGIWDITVVVGFMKEKYDFLIDDYGVKLVVNSAYSVKNNLHSLRLVADLIGRTYILPCDIFFEENPFRTEELYSWYAIGDKNERTSTVQNTRKKLLKKVENNGRRMIGLAYLSQEDAAILIENLQQLDDNDYYANSFWEDALLYKDSIPVYSRIFHNSDVQEVNTFEDLRAIDTHSDQLENKAIALIKDKMNVTLEEISHISTLKKGMTNRSFKFAVDQEMYIMRIPGEGTEKLINRKEEAHVYHAIAEQGLCDDVVYIDPKTGYKITKFLKNSRVCNPNCLDDIKKCMTFLKKFHEMELKVEHTFDLFEKINYYESLWQGIPSAYPDYYRTKEQILSLQNFIDKYKLPYTLTHIDAVPDNFLIAKEKGKEEIRLIDWEYSAMQDRHIDIAMFGIYTLYNRTQMDQLIDIYFNGNCDLVTRTKIYAYIACCGLLWSNWCEYKSHLGIEFGEYSLRQYRYAKDYYQLVQKTISYYNL